MFVAATFGTIGQMFLTYAFTHHRAARVAPFTYVTVAFGGVMGWIYWGELPDIFSVLGAALVVIGCITMMSQPQQPDLWQETGRLRDPG